MSDCSLVSCKLFEFEFELNLMENTWVQLSIGALEADNESTGVLPSKLSGTHNNWLTKGKETSVVLDKTT